jgi:hypothetical protein
LTIAISIKINDGLVLASDSASTVLGQTPDGQLQVFNVYNNADKVFNLQKGLPIGAITWGAGSIGQASTSTIMKDLRKIFTEGDEEKHPNWKLDKKAYTVESVAHRLKQFVFDELYAPTLKDFPHKKPDLGFIVAGYSANAPMADEFQIDIKEGVCKGPRPVHTREQIGMTWAGDGEALNRLLVGVSSGLPQVLQSVCKLQPDQMPQVMQLVQQTCQLPLVLPAMPLQDAIDLSEFLVDLTIKFSRFKLGPPTVGGPIEIAAISKHEGFRWIKRKYYFDRDLNPEERFTRVYEPESKEPGNKEQEQPNKEDKSGSDGGK